MSNSQLSSSLLLGCALLMSATGEFAMAAATDTPLCDGAATQTSASVSSNSLYIMQSFSFTCSPNVVLHYAETNTGIGVCAASNRGGAMYGGVTDGHSVISRGTWSSGDSMTANTTSGC